MWIYKNFVLFEVGAFITNMTPNPTTPIGAHQLHSVALIGQIGAEGVPC